MLSVAFLYLPFAKILRILSLPLPILGEAHCHGHRIAFKQTKEKNRQSYLYPGGRPWAAYPFPTRLLQIEYFPLPPRNFFHCHQGIFPAATKEYFLLPPPNIFHCYHRIFPAATKENCTFLSQSRGFFPFHIPLTWPPFVTLGAND